MADKLTETGFDRFLREKLREPSFRDAYGVARAEIAATDAVARERTREQRPPRRPHRRS